MTALDETTTGTAFPGSRKTYLQGSRPDLQVPMREVVAHQRRQRRPLRHQRPLHRHRAAHRHPARPARRCGRPGSRSAATPSRTTDGRCSPIDNGAEGARPPQPRQRLRRHPPAAQGAAGQDRHPAAATPSRASSRPEMEFVAVREGVAAEFVRDELAAAGSSCRSTSTTPRASRWRSAATSW